MCRRLHRREQPSQKGKLPVRATKLGNHNEVITLETNGAWWWWWCCVCGEEKGRGGGGGGSDGVFDVCVCPYTPTRCTNLGGRTPGTKLPASPPPLPRPDGGGTPGRVPVYTAQKTKSGANCGASTAYCKKNNPSIHELQLWSSTTWTSTTAARRRSNCDSRVLPAPRHQKHQTTESEGAIHKAVSATNARFPNSVDTYGNEHMSTKPRRETAQPLSTATYPHTNARLPPTAHQSTQAVRSSVVVGEGEGGRGGGGEGGSGGGADDIQ